ncbi:hypothetical protein GCM10027347_60960 [Larkinella harenae]
MRKLVGHRLMLAGFYLVIGLVLTILGRTQALTKNQKGIGKASTINQQIVSAFRHLMAEDVKITTVQ